MSGRLEWTGEKLTQLLVISSGMLEATDGEWTFGLSSFTPSASGKRKRAESSEPVTAAQSNHEVSQLSDFRSVARTKASNDVLDPSSAWSSCICAVVGSLQYFVAQKSRYIPLFLGQNSGLHLLGRLSSERAASSPTLDTLFSVKALWTLDGHFLCLAHPCPVPHSIQRRSVTAGSGDRVILAPFGRAAVVVSETSKATILPSESVSPIEDRKDEARIPREVSANVLRRRGIDMSDESHWTQLSVVPHNRNSFSNTLIEWPAWLCLPLADEVQYQNISPTMDPLARAESWYINRHARNDLIKSQQRQQQQASSDANINLKMSTDDDKFDLNASKIQQDLQNAAGIYPTPPDGSKFQSSGQAAETGSVNVSSPENDRTQQSLQHEDSKSELESLEPSIDHGSYEKYHDDGLFAEMGRNMDSNNGVTEADFSFFDEPNNSTPPANAPALAAAPNERLESEDTPMQASSDVLASKTHADAVPSSGSQDNKEINGDQSLEEAGSMVDSFPPTQMQSVDRPRSRKIEQSNYDEHQRDSGSQAQKAGMRLDLKYFRGGKFGAMSGLKPVPDGRPGSLSITNDRIPRLRDQCADTESGDEASSDSNSHSSSPNLAPRKPDINGDVPSSARPKYGPYASATEDRSAQSRMEATTGEQDHMDAENLIKLLEDSTNAQCRGPYPAHEGLKTALSLSDARRMQVAQLINDQAVHFSHLANQSPSMKVGLAVYMRTIMDDPLSSALPSVFPASERCNLLECAQLGGQPTPKPLTRSTSSTLSKDSEATLCKNNLGTPGLVTNLSTPDIRTRRGNRTIDLLPTALPFWEELGLAPNPGDKDVTVICICPDTGSARRRVTTFLETLSQTYSSLQFGNLALGDGRLGKHATGLAPCPAAYLSEPQASSLAKEFSTSLGKYCRYA